MGDVRVLVSANQAILLVAAGNAFATNFVDLVNAPSQDFAIILDPDGRHIVHFLDSGTPINNLMTVTFYKIAVKTIEATWKAGQAALLVRFPKGMSFNRNDLGTNQYKRITSLCLPDMSVKVLLTKTPKSNLWLEAAEITTEAYIDIYSSPYNHQALTRAQLAFVVEQDSLTGRAKRIFDQLNRTEGSKPQSGMYAHIGPIEYLNASSIQMTSFIIVVFMYLDPVYLAVHLFRNVHAIIYLLVIFACPPGEYRLLISRIPMGRRLFRKLIEMLGLRRFYLIYGS